MASQDGGASAWGGGGDGDSLFEGMVLFTPSLSVDPDPEPSVVEAPDPKPPTPCDDPGAGADVVAGFQQQQPPVAAPAAAAG
uniref:Uncharacterized protein n=1 Tax=Oryza brachyantha TaxID=4533 RepID=J3MUF0_ORYBR